MKKQLLGMIFAVVFATSPSFSEDCGEPPLDQPAIPDGAAATADEIRSARNAVVSYSAKVDEYLTCMDLRAVKLVPFMTKEQKVRWDEDLADLHDTRRELQNQMNLAIRSYREAQQSS